jgi:hypothetical protein
MAQRAKRIDHVRLLEEHTTHLTTPIVSASAGEAMIPSGRLVPPPPAVKETTTSGTPPCGARPKLWKRGSLGGGAGGSREDVVNRLLKLVGDPEPMMRVSALMALEKMADVATG